jgi:hypothetical protein
VSLGGGAEVAEFACAGGGGVEAEGHIFECRRQGARERGSKGASQRAGKSARDA